MKAVNPLDGAQPSATDHQIGGMEKRAKIQIPDLRLEYQTPAGDAGRVDLELATEHYKPSQLAAKAQAGFTIYAPASHAGRITAALDERSITAEILSL